MTEKRTCPYAKACGACAFTGQPYEETLKEKERTVAKLLAPYVRLEGITGMEHPYGYRNKVHRVYGLCDSGRTRKRVSGIYAAGSHQVVPVRGCLIEDERAQEILRTVTELMDDFRIRYYDEDSGQGLLRHVLIRTAHATGQIMVTLVLASPVLPGKKHFLEKLLKRHPEITTVVININDRPTNAVLGAREQTAYGRGYIEDVLCGKTFRISSRSFYQVNPVQTEKLYLKAMEMAQLNGHGRVIDAYCGIGTIGLIAADRVKEVIGVESNREAVRDAAANAKLNGARNIRFTAADAGEFLTMLSAEEKADVVFLDPPRAGASEAFLRAAAASSPGRIVYISCNPETLARDLGILKKLGYRAKEAAAFDMFPWTEAQHVETVVGLVRTGGRNKGGT